MSSNDVAGDKIGGDKITAGDIHASNVAIGRGAQLIVNQIHQTLSAVEELEKTIQAAERRLALAISEKIARYASLDIAPVDDPAHNRMNPYKSLLDYKLEDAPYFFGREEATRTMLERIQQRRLTVLHSESGSGKTSLLQAGLASRLLAEGHLPLYLRPYRQPPGQFIKRAFLPDYATRPELAHFRDDQMSLKGFLDRVCGYLGDRRLYIFLDQFEELFTELDLESQRIFAAELQDCVESDLSAWWVLALRKEYFSDLRLFRSLKPFDNEYFLQTFNLAEAQEVVTKPAALKNVQYEAGLVSRMLSDIRLEAEAIPPAQVQLVCYTLFEELPEEPNPNLITHALYEKPRGRSGGHGAAGILTSHMTRVLDRELKGRERQTATRILEALVTSDMRRVLRTEARLIEDLAPVDSVVLANVLDALYENRLIRRELDEQDQPLYELTHDYLLTEIELDPETKARKAAQEMLNREVVAWQNNPALRIPADRLDMISAHQDQLVLSAEAAELLDLSRKALQRRRRLTLAGGSVVLILIIAAVLSVFTAIGAQRLADAAQNTLATATVQLAAAEDRLEEAQIEQELAAAQQATAEAATTLAEKRVADLEQLSAALDLAQRSLGNADPETALFLAIQAARQGDEDTPLQVKQALWHSLSGGLWRVLEGHEGAVIHASFSHDSRYLASVGADDTIRIWEVATGRQRYLFDSASGAFTTYAFSFDDAYLAAGNEGGNIQVWNLETGQQRHDLSGHAGPILSLIFGPDNLYLASGSTDNTIRLWDVETGAQLDEFCEAQCGEDSFGSVSHIVFSPDGQYSASYAGSLEFLIRTLPEGEERLLSYGSELGHTSFVYELTFSANSRLLGAVGNFSGVWNVDTFDSQTSIVVGDDLLFNPSDQYFVSAAQVRQEGETLNPLLLNAEAEFDAAFHPGNRYYARTEPDNTVHIWDGETGAEINVLRGHKGSLNSVVFSGNGRYLASASEDNTIRIWQGVLLADSGPKVYDFLATPDTHIQDTGITFSQDGRYLVTGRDAVIIWELATGEQQQVLVEDMLWKSYSRLKLNPDGDTLVGATPETWGDQEVVVWDVASAAELCQVRGHDRSSLSADGRIFATVETDNLITIFDTSNCQKLYTLESHEDSVAGKGSALDYNRISFSEDGDYLAAFDSTELAVHVWELASGERRQVLTGGTEFNELSSEIVFDPTGSFLASTNFAKIHVLDIAAGEITLTTGDDDIRVHDFAFSPDGRKLVAGYADGLVRLWDNAAGDELLVMRGHTGRISSVAYSHDGRFIASTDSETVNIWDAETGDELYSFDLILFQGVPQQSFLSGHYLEFSSQDDYIILVTESGKVHVWYFDAVEAMLASARDRLGPTLQAELDESNR